MSGGFRATGGFVNRKDAVLSSIGYIYSSVSSISLGLSEPPSQRGVHQFHLPIRRIVDGTTRALTIVASRRMANAKPNP